MNARMLMLSAIIPFGIIALTLALWVMATGVSVLSLAALAAANIVVGFVNAFGVGGVALIILGTVLLRLRK